MSLPYPELKPWLKDERDFMKWYKKKLIENWYRAEIDSDFWRLTQAPWDLSACDPWGFWIAIEWKMINSKKWNIRRHLKKHQRAHLRWYNGLSYVVVFNRKLCQYRIFDFDFVLENKDNKVEMFS